MYGPRGLQVIGLSSGGQADARDLETFVASTGVTFPVLVDTESTYEQYQSDADVYAPYPIDVVVDADGTIVYLSRTYEPDALAAAVESVLAGR